MKAVLLIAATLLPATPVLVAQRSGGGGGQGQRQTQGQGQGQTRQSQSGLTAMDWTRQLERERLGTQATDRQRRQFQNCAHSIERLGTQARDMIRTSSGASFNARLAQQQHDQLREQLRTVVQEHERLMQGLNSEQRAAVEPRTKTMQQTQERINHRLKSMDMELAKSSPKGKRVADQARIMERETAEIQQQYREMGDDLSLRNR